MLLEVNKRKHFVSSVGPDDISYPIILPGVFFCELQMEGTVVINTQFNCLHKEQKPHKML